jgi:UPF0755 protein
MSAFGFPMQAPPPKRIKAWVPFVFIGSVIAGAIFLIAQVFGPPADFEGNGIGEALVTVEPGDTLSAIGAALVDAGVVASVESWVAATSGDSRALSIGPGDYVMREQMGSRQALELILDPATRKVTKLVVREGERVTEVIKNAAEISGIARDEFVAVLKSPKAYGLPSPAERKPEGYLFPATYEIEKSDTAADILRKMTTRWKEAASEIEIGRRAARLGLSTHEILTVASIVEVEAGPEDYSKVARVIYNRLKIDMRLQLDSTVNYALGISKLQLSADQMNTESAYNTYRVQGLPPGPIGNPGTAAIEAALEPATGSWLYFVTVDPKTKLTKFATSYEEFLRYKREFQNNVNN